MTEQPDWGAPPATGGHVPAAAGPPPPVANAVRLMLARAALSLLGLVALFLTQDSLRQQVVESDPSLSGGTVDTAVTVALVGGAVFAVLFVALYLFLASQVRRGRSWARTTTLVLAGLSALSGLASLLQPAPSLSRVIGLVVLGLDIAIFALLLSPRSGPFFDRTVR